MNDDRHCDLLIRNAYVISVDAERRVFSPGAVAVRGTRVAAVGPEREVIEGLGRRAARTIDARGAAVHPGFIDAHNHVVGAGCSPTRRTTRQVESTTRRGRPTSPARTRRRPRP